MDVGTEKRLSCGVRMEGEQQLATVVVEVGLLKNT